jgi:formamidopyrimidine-DNA glycosylase
VPELPDLEYVAGVLARDAVRRTIETVRVGDPTVLRVMVEGTPAALLCGRTVESVARRGHFLRFGLSGGLVMVVNAMLVGRVVILPAKRAGKAMAIELGFSGGSGLRYVDDKRMGKVYVCPAAREKEIPQLGTLGIDVLALTREAFEGLITKRRDQVRMFLMDKTALASIGNAYADEILFAARIHPKTFCKKLGPAERDALYRAIGEVLHAAIAEVTRRGAPVEVKVRDFLAVRGRDGQPCKACGTTIRAVRVGAGDACFCPTCQPATRALFIDWRKLDR